MPLSLPRHPREKVGRLQTQGGFYEDVAEHQNPKGTAFFFFYTYPGPSRYHYYYHAYPASPLVLLSTFIY